MSMSNSLESSMSKHLFQNLTIANVGDATGLPAAATAGSLYVGLHTADPGEAGSQTTSEATYTSYARKAVVRSSAGWTETSGTITNAALVTFDTCTGGSNTITHYSIGTALSGTGVLLFSGALGASLAVSNLVTPEFAIGGISVVFD